MALRILIFSLWLTTPCAIAAAAEVEASAKPSRGELSLTLEELWRIGGDTDAEGEFFGVIGDLIVGEDGTVYLLDRQLAEIKAFTADGEYLRTFGREGEGPGEFRRPSGFFRLPDGSFGITQFMSDDVPVLDAMGNPGENLSLFEGEGRRMIFQAGQAGPNFILSVLHQRFGDGSAELTAELSAFDASGNIVGTYHSTNRTLDFSAPVIDETENTRPLWSADNRGNVDVVSEYGRYAVHRFSPSGEKTRILTRDYTSLPRSKKELEEARSRFVLRGPLAEPEIIVSETHPDIQELYTTPEGGLWVLTSRGARPQDGNVVGVWDVLNPEGEFTHQVTLIGEGDPLGDGLVFSGDRLYVIRGQVSGMRSMFGGNGQESEDEYLDPMEVICYRIPSFQN